tara:strand:+ start:1183 stop:1461 length:279 start_codon:yes stop_codon:yes gene_type:complete
MINKITGKNYLIHIVWGEEPEAPLAIETYGFKTNNEALAFLNGVWLGNVWTDASTSKIVKANESENELANFKEELINEFDFDESDFKEIGDE